MAVIIDLPKAVECHLRESTPNFDRQILETIALDLFRNEKITIFEFRLMLGMSREEADDFLISRKEYAQTLTDEDLDDDRRTQEYIEKVRRK